jgi:hypothetical protein
MTAVCASADGGIREDVPAKYRQRFEKWKAELLSTNFGREEWNRYATRKDFTLTIKVTSERGKGAGTDKFKWDDFGNFVGATITLGADLDEGYPTPVYYPVLNSLSPADFAFSIDGKILAATKLSHEIGHVNQTAQVNATALQLQNKLVPLYYSIFLNNGRNTNDKKLLEIVDQIGGTPIEIWESREYWSEVNAMLYLQERLGKEVFYCDVFNKIRRNLKDYARDYEQRFDQVAEYSNSPCWK